MTLRQKQRGASASSYALVVGLVGVVAIAALSTVGEQIRIVFCKVAEPFTGEVCVDGFLAPGEEFNHEPPTITLTEPYPSMPLALNWQDGQMTYSGLGLRVEDGETPANQLTLTATVRFAGQDFEMAASFVGTGNNRTANIAFPSPNQPNWGEITFTVTDAGSPPLSDSLTLPLSSGLVVSLLLPELVLVEPELPLPEINGIALNEMQPILVLVETDPPFPENAPLPPSAMQDLPVLVVLVERDPPFPAWDPEEDDPPAVNNQNPGLVLVEPDPPFPG